MAFIFRTFHKTYTAIIDGIIKRLPIYYKSIHKMPVYNWFMCQQNDLKYMYKVRLFNYVPAFFLKVLTDMVYQFDKLDLTVLRKQSEYEILRSLAARQQDKNLKFNADLLKKEIEKLENKSKKDVNLTIDGFIDYIELTFDRPGTLDPFKISTARAFSLYHKAVEKNEAARKHYENINSRM